MQEEMDSSPIGFPVLFDPFEEDVALQLCMCPFCQQSHWIVPRPEYYFTCHCGGVSIFDGLAMRPATSAEYEVIRNANRMRTVGFA